MDWAAVLAEEGRAMTNLPVGFETTDDDDLPLSIQHHRDRVIVDGKLDQDYRFLTYRFASASGQIEARTYLDNAREVSITEPIDIPELPADVMAYLQMRFRLIKQLGGPDGYRVIWEKS
jgi:hypothetical protein